MAKGAGKLTALEGAKKTVAGYYGDGGGLWLQISTAGTKSWIFRFKSPVTGKAREMGLGSLDTFSLAEARNRAKAELLYAEIDRNGLFRGTTAKEDRSWMNATFLLNDESHQDAFNALCKAAGIVGLKGHRSVGGYRASMYNALELSDVQALVDAMQAFEKSHG